MRKEVFLGILGGVLGLAMLTGCVESDVDPETMVSISGKYVDENGEPLENFQIGVWVLDFTISLNNYWYPDPRWERWTDSDGYFEFQVKGEELLWGDKYAKYIILANIEELEEPVTAVGFYVIDSINALPDLKLWDANVQQTIASDTATFTWDGVSSVAGSEPKDGYGFSAKLFYWALWHENDVNSGFSLPTYIFQNTCLGWRVAAEFPRANDNEKDYSYMSAAYKEEGNLNILPNSSHQLLSKTKEAYIPDHDTAFTKLTDGVFKVEEDFNAAHPAWVKLDLGASQSINSFVVYGLWTNYATSTHNFDQFEVYVSEDDAAWDEAVATSTQEDGYIRFDFDAVDGQYIKFQANDGSNIRIAWIREIAAFGPAAE